MTRVIGAVSVIGLLFSSSEALAQERCLATYYKLPPSIAEELRPYLLCGLIHDRSDTGEAINGVTVLMHGQNPEACGKVRASAFAAADQRLASTLREPTTRRAYLD